MEKTINFQIDKDKLPHHIAIIMDGNGRWAQQKGLDRVFGHREGAETVRKILTESGKLGIPYLTLYAFSTENWNRPRAEVDALMTLLSHSLRNELDNLMKNQVRMNVIGNVAALPDECRQELQETLKATSNNKGITLTLALSYSGRWELTDMVRNIAQQVSKHQISWEDIDETTLQSALNSYPIPDPDILIRTGGEYRISNFLLWQIAYTELFFSPVMWPDFNEQHLHEIIAQFQNRERRFGKTGEQVHLY